VHAAEPMMSFIMLIDRCGFSKLGESFLPKMLEAMTIRDLGFAIACAAACGSLAVLCRVGVNSSPKLQGDEPLHISHVVQRSRHVAVLRIAFLVERNGGSETVDCVLVSALASGDSSVRRMDIAQSDVIIGLAQYYLRLLQNAGRLLHISFLKVEPALENSHDC